MAIKPPKEINRMPGYAVLKGSDGVTNVSEILAGQAVRIVDSSTITLADGSLSATSYAVFGIASDTTTAYSAGGKYTIQDDFAKNGYVGCYINGGVFEVWNDGRGAVFASDVVNAPVGSALYIDSSGCWTITAGSASTAGAQALGILIEAPTATTGTLKFQFNM